MCSAETPVWEIQPLSSSGHLLAFHSWHESQMKVAAGFMWPSNKGQNGHMSHLILRQRDFFDYPPIKETSLILPNTAEKPDGNWQLDLIMAMATVLPCRHCALCAQRHPALLLGTIWSLWHIWVPASCWNHEESSQLPSSKPSVTAGWRSYLFQDICVLGLGLQNFLELFWLQIGQLLTPLLLGRFQFIHF